MTEPLIDLRYLAFATEAQSKYLNAVNEHGGVRAAARHLNVDHGTISTALKRLRATAATSGFSPDHDMIRPVPSPFIAKGVSTYYNKDGQPAGQWVKSQIDQRQLQEAMKAAADAMAEDLPRLDPIERPPATLENLLNLYTMTDCHVGMLAWRMEGGQDWDLKIAEKTLVGCFEQMILAAPPAKIGVVNQLGDFLHTDGLIPQTPTSHNVLDADGRFPKMVGIAVRVLRRMIDLSLMKHDEVIVLLAEGNHDMASSVWFQVMFAALYEHEPRVKVIVSALPYYAIEHGKTMLAFHHGHMKKPDDLTAVMAAQFAPIWGRTTKRYAHMGHQHHLYEREHAGMIVTQHPTLAARDAYAARGGWFAERAASVITYHTEYGQVAKNTVVPEMLV